MARTNAERQAQWRKRQKTAKEAELNTLKQEIKELKKTYETRIEILQKELEKAKFCANVELKQAWLHGIVEAIAFTAPCSDHWTIQALRNFYLFNKADLENAGRHYEFCVSTGDLSHLAKYFDENGLLDVNK
jgi:predicted RNase H-like nuclease (RuvC/YqgF family)